MSHKVDDGDLWSVALVQIRDLSDISTLPVLALLTSIHPANTTNNVTILGHSTDQTDLEQQLMLDVNILAISRRKSHLLFSAEYYTVLIAEQLV